MLYHCRGANLALLAVKDPCTALLAEGIMHRLQQRAELHLVAVETRVAGNVQQAPSPHALRHHFADVDASVVVAHRRDDADCLVAIAILKVVVEVIVMGIIIALGSSD